MLCQSVCYCLLWKKMLENKAYIFNKRRPKELFLFDLSLILFCASKHEIVQFPCGLQSAPRNVNIVQLSSEKLKVKVIFVKNNPYSTLKIQEIPHFHFFI